MERITNKGNSSLLLQLAEKVGSVAVAPATLSENVVAMTRINTPEEKAPVRVTPQREVTGLTQRINRDDDFYIKNQSTEVILMKANVCNDPDINRWNLNMFPSLRVVVVGDNCLECLKELKLDGLKCLEKVEIGAKCFCESEGCFEVNGCSALKSVKLGDGCCVKWGSFVIMNCGVVEVSIGDGCFVSCDITVFENLSALTKLTVGNEAFKGDEKKESVLVMKSECFER